MSPHANHFSELIVYQKCFIIQQEIFKLTREFPKAETYSLTDQIRRSSRSIGANIAEAWKKRKYVAHFRSKLSDSDSELAETQHWLFTMRDCNYISSETCDYLFNSYEEIGKILGHMIENAETWCSSTK